MRHDAIANVIAYHAKLLGAETMREPRDSDGAIPDLLIRWHDREVWVEVSVVNPLARSYKASATRNIKAPLAEREKRKIAKYQDQVQAPTTLVAAVFSAFGPYSEGAQSLMKLFSEVARTFKVRVTKIAEVVAIQIQRGNAIALLQGSLAARSTVPAYLPRQRRSSSSSATAANSSRPPRRVDQAAARRFCVRVPNPSCAIRGGNFREVTVQHGTHMVVWLRRILNYLPNPNLLR
jgi:hypothetical protein